MIKINIIVFDEEKTLKYLLDYSRFKKYRELEIYIYYSWYSLFEG